MLNGQNGHLGQSVNLGVPVGTSADQEQDIEFKSALRQPVEENRHVRSLVTTTNNKNSAGMAAVVNVSFLC